MFESLDLPVLFETEVVVAGGGPAGIAAALAAARLGKRVVLLEQTGSLGGMGTNALVPAVIYQSDGVNWVVGDFCRSIIEECCREMGIDEVNPGWQEVDAEILKRIYDDRLLKAGVKLFYMIRVGEARIAAGRHPARPAQGQRRSLCRRDRRRCGRRLRRCPVRLRRRRGADHESHPVPAVLEHRHPRV